MLFTSTGYKPGCFACLFSTTIKQIVKLLITQVITFHIHRLIFGLYCKIDFAI